MDGAKSGDDALRRRTLIVVVPIAPSVPVLAWGSADVLKSVPGIKVLVIDVPRGATDIGLTTERLQTVTELKLRESGIKILSQDEWNKTPGGPTLVIAVNIVGVGCSIDVSFREIVFVSRQGKAVAIPNSETWGRSVAGTTHTPEFVVDREKELLDIFCNDWLKANPRQ